MEEIKAFVFDMDGTVVSTTRADYLAWKRLFDEYNLAFSYKEYLRVLGVKSSEVIKMKANVAPKELQGMLSQKMIYFKDIVIKSGISKIPYVEAFLKELKHRTFKMGLATGARREKMDLVFEKTKLTKYFDIYISGDEVRSGKPNPEIFIKAAKRLSLKPSEIIVVEDAENGVLAAKNAGCKCIAITTTTPAKKLAAADVIIKSYQFLDVANLLRNNFPINEY